jgi:predicted alpha/beta-hydrolase family hydrolase
VSPRSRKPAAALLFPGAGSSAASPSLVAIEQALAPMPVQRADFPYRREGRRAPDRPPKLLACVVEEAGLLADSTGAAPNRIVLGGRSMGGRICSMAVADGLPAAALVLISYPLHPPGRPDRLRIEHLPALEVPCLFVSGTRDAFGTPAELEQHTASIPGPVTHVWIEGKGHDLKGCDARVAEVVAEWVQGLR